MANAKNVAAVAELKQRFESTNAVVLTEYRGLSVAQTTQLRKALGSDVTYSVAKNTMIKLAAKEAGVEGLDDVLTGPTAIAFIEGEAVDAAKAMKDFGKDNKAFVVKGGYMDGEFLSAAQVEAIAELDNRETTLAKLAGAMQGSLAKAAGLFNAPASQIARLSAALQEKKQGEE
ncbi:MULTISPECIES: 50S ribosomal protein L10 [unclassified Corynebacterium]|uniref:50S ribosomal protein L10 n=1 Tax=unclassified Corynebacterium TaxID=2624378 RepID=UPI0035261776